MSDTCKAVVNNHKHQVMGVKELQALNKDLISLLNRHSCENLANIPDHILAAQLIGALFALGDAVIKREEWFGYRNTPGQSCPTKIKKHAEEIIARHKNAA
jgi:hypothetical protein